MDCSQLQNLVGMRCNQIGDAVEIITPFTFADGDGFEIFAKSYGQQILFFDDGLSFNHLSTVGINVGLNRKRWKSLKSIADKYGVTLSNDGVFEVFCPTSNPGIGFAGLVSTMLGVAAWELEQSGVSQDSAWLIDEVAMYLKAWKPKAKMLEKPEVRGFSGRILSFDFDFDGQYVDAIQPHSASTGAELRKIVDLNSASDAIKKDVLVIIDDRLNFESAKQEVDIIGRVANVWPMSRLIATVGGNGTRQ